MEPKRHAEHGKLLNLIQSPKKYVADIYHFREHSCPLRKKALHVISKSNLENMFETDENGLLIALVIHF